MACMEWSSRFLSPCIQVFKVLDISEVRKAAFIPSLSCFFQPVAFQKIILHQCRLIRGRPRSVHMRANQDIVLVIYRLLDTVSYILLDNILVCPHVNGPCIHPC